MVGSEQSALKDPARCGFFLEPGAPAAYDECVVLLDRGVGGWLDPSDQTRAST